jgi:cullin-4
MSKHALKQNAVTDNLTAEAEVKRTLQSLACAKLRPLTKHPKGKDVNETDTFSVNLGFEHPTYRVKINQVQLKETKEENQETHMRVAEDRNFETQAAIVRIMKSRKTISHAELVAEVIKATISRGVLGVADIKKNIDRLIEKDYMEREDGNMYSYVA